MQTSIKHHRLQAQLTQQQLAEKVGVRRETIVFLEMGKYNPSLRLAFQIAQVFGVSIEEVFSFDDEEAKIQEHN